MSIPDEKLPWFKFFPTDWLGDSHLQATRASTRGIWMNLISHMKRRGVGELEVGIEKLAQLGCCTAAEAAYFLVDMATEEAANVFSVQPDGGRVPLVRHADVTPNVARLYVVESRRLSRETKKKKADRERQDRKRADEPSRESRADVTPPVTAEPERLRARESSEFRDQSEEKASENVRADARRPAIEALREVLARKTGVLNPDGMSLIDAANRITAYSEIANEPVGQVAERAIMALAKISGGWSNPQAVTTQRLVSKWEDIQGQMAGMIPKAVAPRPSSTVQNRPLRKEPPQYRDADDILHEEETATRERLKKERAAGGGS